MKYLLSLVFGVVIGALISAVLLYFNPLSLSQGPAAARDSTAFAWSMSPSDIWLATHDNSVDLPVVPTDLPLLYEKSIKGVVLTAMPLQTDEGTAMASRISVPSPQTEFIKSGFVTDDYWLVTLPDRGTLFVHGESNQWPMLRDTLVTVDLLRREWNGPASYVPTRGPGRAGASVLGLTGDYTGAIGHAMEKVEVRSYDSTALLLSGELLLDLQPAAEPDPAEEP